MMKATAPGSALPYGRANDAVELFERTAEQDILLDIPPHILGCLQGCTCQTERKLTRKLSKQR